MSGTISSSQLAGAYSNLLTFNNAANQFSGTFNGNGGALSNVNAATLGGLAASNFWQTAGNTGTSPCTNFLGTSDNQPLEFRVNGQRVLRLTPNSNGGPNLLGGSSANVISPGVVGGTIIGGGSISYLGFPYTNSIASDFDFVGGGGLNTIDTNSPFSAIVGGVENQIGASSGYAFIGGGTNNTVSGPAATVLGGSGNFAAGPCSAAMGVNSVAGGFAAVAMGQNSKANGNYSLAAGLFAQATNHGAYVWNDQTGSAFSSTNDNSFNVRASGGVRLLTSGAGLSLDGPLGVTGGGISGNGGLLTNVNASSFAGLAISNFWKTGGNSGVNSNQFLGTADNNALEFRANSFRALRLESNTNGAPNVIGGSVMNRSHPGFRGL